MRLYKCVNLYFMQSIAQVVIFFNFTSKQLLFIIVGSTSTPLSVTIRKPIILFILCQSERSRRL